MTKQTSILPVNIKSPLRYPGGKSRAVDLVLKLIPKKTTTLCSPFFGGGSIEINCAAKGMEVQGYDVFTPLVEFWQCLLSSPARLADGVEKYYPLEKKMFYELQNTQTTFKGKYERAAIFYVLNRASFSGATLSGGMSPGHPRFTPSSIQRLRDFRLDRIAINKADFLESIPLHKNDFLYLDPPYLIPQALYGENGNTHKNFNHKALRETLKNRESWILSYNNSPEIHRLYKGHTFLYPSWKYGMSTDKNSKEVLILSHDIAAENEIGEKHANAN